MEDEDSSEQLSDEESEENDLFSSEESENSEDPPVDEDSDVEPERGSAEA